MIKGEHTMKKIVILLVVLVIVFAFTIPASAGGNGPGSGIGPGDGTGPVGGLGPIGGTDSGGKGSGSGQGQQGARGIFIMVGEITAIGTDTVTINVIRGNKLVQPYLGTQVTVTVTSNTRYLYKDGTTTTTIGFVDLQVGQSVSVNGNVANNVWAVSRITVGASLSCLP
jgi:hypothetical protein